MNKNRVHSIDLLRGIMAISVMVYHYSSWSIGGLDSSDIWSRFGLYAVSIFYFISGFSLAYVYWDKVDFSVKDYMLRRFFRIAPLFYLVSILAFAYQFSKTGELDFIKAFLNFTFLFSIFDPSAYYSTGAWSIGNEMFFYFIFALILASNNRHKWLIISLVVSLVSIYYFRGYELDFDQGLSSQWPTYINPLNHAICFLFGICAYTYRAEVYRICSGLIGKIVCFSSAGLIFVLPIEGDRINLVVGWNGILLMLSSLALFLLFLVKDGMAIFNTKLSTFLGDISYSVYLVHPFCWFFIKKIFAAIGLPLSGLLFWVLSILITIFVSFCTYQLVEKVGITIGKRYMRLRPSTS